MRVRHRLHCRNQLCVYSLKCHFHYRDNDDDLSEVILMPPVTSQPKQVALMQADATALSQAIASGRLTATEAMQASLAAAQTLSDLGSITYQDAEKGLEAAARIDALAPGDPARTAMVFAGVPTLAKDLGGPFAGFPVAAGSRLMARRGGMIDSDLAQRFRAAGLCVFGLTTSPEFGLALASEPEIGPICRNPLDPSRTAGGSSGGSAAAVAAGIVAIAHATDAGGSIRVPAACCGLVGHSRAIRARGGELRA